MIELNVFNYMIFDFLDLLYNINNLKDLLFKFFVSYK